MLNPHALAHALAHAHLTWLPWLIPAAIALFALADRIYRRHRTTHDAEIEADVILRRDVDQLIKDHSAMRTDLDQLLKTAATRADIASLQTDMETFRGELQQHMNHEDESAEQVRQLHEMVADIRGKLFDTEI